jgi:hypothetical protein
MTRTTITTYHSSSPTLGRIEAHASISELTLAAIEIGARNSTQEPLRPTLPTMTTDVSEATCVT